MSDRLTQFGNALDTMKRQRDEAEAAAESKSARISEAKEAVCEAAKAMYLTPEGERLSYIRQLGSLMLLVDALIKAEGE